MNNEMHGCICVNGHMHEVSGSSRSGYLSEYLRDSLGHTGLKVACDQGACGACTVIMDGKAVLSCMILTVEAVGHEVQTIEGLPADDPVILAFSEQCEPGYGTAMQCGYCTPGFVMAAKALLAENPTPTLEQIRAGLSGNLCRCGCYPAIERAVLRASERMVELAPNAHAASQGCDD